jgi:excisionase family DNA binding protein
MTAEMTHRLKQIAQLGQVNLDELSLGITQESRALAILSEERRQAIQELLGLIGQMPEEDSGNDGNPQQVKERNRPMGPMDGISGLEKSPFPSTKSEGNAFKVDEDGFELDSPHGNWLTVNQVSSILRVNPLTVRRWIHSGQISHVVLPGRGYRIGGSDLASFISAHYQRAD